MKCLLFIQISIFAFLIAACGGGGNKSSGQNNKSFVERNLLVSK
jgi:hypothetical protein